MWFRKSREARLAQLDAAQREWLVVRNEMLTTLQVLVQRTMEADRALFNAYRDARTRGLLDKPETGKRIGALIDCARRDDLLRLVFSDRIKREESIFLEHCRRAAETASMNAPQVDLRAALNRAEQKSWVADLTETVNRAVTLDDPGTVLSEYFARFDQSIPAQITDSLARNHEYWWARLAQVVEQERIESDRRLREKENYRRAEEIERQKRLKGESEAAAVREAERLRQQVEAARLAAERIAAEEQERLNRKRPRVFVVHGHDQHAVLGIDSLLRRIGCEPLIFSRLPRPGSLTNIEILERVLPDCEAVVVLLTPDDEGRRRNSESPLEFRARQNVLIEAGCAIISFRPKAVIVAVGGVSIPSDLDGIDRVESMKWGVEVEVQIARRLGDLFGDAVNMRAI